MTKQLKIERLQNAALQLMSKINSALETDAPEGLFRLSADKHLMDAKMSEIEKGKFNFDTLSQIERAALLKAVLRELRSEQGPLFTQEQFKQLTDVEMPVAVNGLLEQKKVADQKITFYLFELLKSLKKYEATTKMPTANLAIIFAPNLFPELPAPNVSKLSSEEALKKTRELQADNDAKVTFIADLVDKATVDPLVIPKPKLSTHYDYQVKAPSENRFHAFSATGKGLDEKFKNLTGDLLKSKILEDFKEQLEHATADNIDQVVVDIEESSEYKALATGQGVMTRLFHLETSSVKAFKDMVAERRADLELENSFKPK